ncbi:hypothetical protein [Kyrpidia spormannii]|uniref:hypothetical protein n=1 Tax=Kyrpidia spormannii TaxID=2055160 RepID=UPI00147593BC|nr:hypothetical protein [Kyrpidia spormannii]
MLVAEEQGEYTFYNAFETADLISSVSRMVEDVRSGKNKKAAVKKWVSEYGFLGANLGSDFVHPKWEALADFWREAETLADLWGKYKQVTQRDMSGLRGWIRFVELPNDGDPLIPSPEGSRTKSDFSKEPGVMSFGTADLFFSATLEEIGQNPLRFYQLAGLRYILVRINGRIKSLELNYTGVEKIENPQDDIFKIRPVLYPRTLLEAMYLQFYILLSGHNVKICKHCGKPFPLKEKYSKNRVYCSDRCNNAAKMRNYRERKRQQVFLPR